MKLNDYLNVLNKYNQLDHLSPLNDLIVNVFPRILLAQILINFLSGHSQRSLHVTAVVVCILYFTPDMDDVVLVPGVTFSVIISTFCYLLPYLRFRSCLICSPNVLQPLETSHVGEVVFQFRGLSVAIKKHVGDYFQHVLY